MHSGGFISITTVIKGPLFLLIFHCWPKVVVLFFEGQRVTKKAVTEVTLDVVALLVYKRYTKSPLFFPPHLHPICSIGRRLR